ncbi:MAG: hypothetical protein OQJ98_02375 [Candidatus Pacebacteria bacterium]|nr:hypothetical protein [Candidatus Paceibacterota bacterium]
MKLYFATTTLFFLSIFLFPWFVTAGLGLLIVARYSGYEVVFGGLMMDLLYGVDIPAFYFGAYIYTIIGIAVLFFGVYIKRHLVFCQS